LVNEKQGGGMFEFMLLVFCCSSLWGMYQEKGSLVERAISTIVNRPHLVSAATNLNHDLQEKVMKALLIEKIKKPLFPIKINKPLKPIIFNHRGVCGLEAITSTKQVISVGCDGKIAFCHEDSMHNCDLVDLNKSWYCASIKNDTHTLYLGGLSGDVGAVRIKDKEPQEMFRAHEQAVNALSFSPDYQQLITCSNDWLIKLWELKHHTCAAVFAGHKRAVKNAFSIQAHQKIISGAADRTVRVWDLHTQKQEHIYQAIENLNVCRLARHPEEHLSVCGFSSGALSLLDIRQEHVHDFLNQHHGVISGILCSDDGRYIASASWDGKVRLWDIRMMACSAVLSFHQDWIQSVASLHNFKKIISGSRDGTVKMWDVSTVLAIDAINNLKDMAAKAALIAEENPVSHQERLAMAQRITTTS
jgi:WD40 repeat protein